MNKDHLFDEMYVCGGGEHKWVEDETFEDCTVQLLKRSECGEYSVGWTRKV